MKYKIHVKSQHRRGASANIFVAVTITPKGVKVPHILRSDILRKRGIGLRYFGEGHERHNGAHSALGKSIAAARDFIATQRAVSAFLSR